MSPGLPLAAAGRPPNAVSTGIDQLALFPTPRPTLRSTTVLPEPADPALAAHCDRVLREHAARHGWTKRLTNVVAASLRAVLAWQDTPGGLIKTSEARRLLRQPSRTTVESTLEILAAAGLLDDDRADAARVAFLTRIAGLPATMTAQMEIWYTIMAEGSKQPPRRRPRHPRTIDVHVSALRPILRAWADHGHESLAEITRDRYHGLAARGSASPGHWPARRCAPCSASSRPARRSSPTRRAGMSFGAKPTNVPLPLDADAIRDGLNSPDPARALAVALVAFHGLLADQVRTIMLTDVRDGRLTVDGRSIPLAGPVQVRLRAYLDHRARRFPNTANPYLLVNRRSAPRLTPVARRYPWHRLELQPRPLREDRILHEVYATGGDVRRSATCSGSASTPLCATRSPSSTPTCRPTDTSPAEARVRKPPVRTTGHPYVPTPGFATERTFRIPEPTRDVPQLGVGVEDRRLGRGEHGLHLHPGH